MKIYHPRMTYAGRQKILLGWLIVISVVVHGALLMIPGESTENTIHLSLSAPLQVTVVSSRSLEHPESIDEIAKPAPPVSREPRRTVSAESIMSEIGEKPIERQPVDEADSNEIDNKNPEIENVREPGSIPIADNSTEQHQLAAADPQARPARTRQSVINDLRKTLNELISARFTYPRMARKMGWEGLVALSLRIEDDGSLNRVRVARSSGHKILDDNARKTIQDIGRLNVASNLLVEAVDTRIEVLYRLTD